MDRDPNTRVLEVVRVRDRHRPLHVDLLARREHLRRHRHAHVAVLLAAAGIVGLDGRVRERLELRARADHARRLARRRRREDGVGIDGEREEGRQSCAEAAIRRHCQERQRHAWQERSETPIFATSFVADARLDLCAHQKLLTALLSSLRSPSAAPTSSRPSRCCKSRACRRRPPTPPTRRRRRRRARRGRAPAACTRSPR